MSKTVISLDFTGTIVTNGYLQHFWEESIPRAYALEKKLTLEIAKRVVLREYNTVESNDINWYLPAYWLRRFGIRSELKELVEESLVALRFYPDAIDLMWKAKDKYKLIVTSGVPSSLLIKPLRVISTNIDKIYSSSDIGIVGKPPEFFKFILEDLGIRSEQMVHVGDDRINDYENPMKVGISSYLVNRKDGITLTYLKNSILSND